MQQPAAKYLFGGRYASKISDKSQLNKSLKT